MCKIMEDLMKDFCLEAKEKGMKEGMREGVRKTALSMLRKKFNVELISELTGLSIKEVEDLSKTA